MANETISPNMNLPIPGVGLTTGPQYALDLDSCLSIIDQHNHTAGNGVQINPAGLNINSDLPFGGNNATLLRSVRFQSQVSPIALATDLGCLSVSGVDLYYRDGSGNSIRLTQSGSIVGTAGSITGLPSGTASASFSAGTFVWQSATNTAATMDMGSVIIRNLTASAHGVTLSVPSALGADYNLVLPSIPGVTSVMTLDNSGNMGTQTYDQVGQNMTSVGANAIGVSMTATGANAVANTRTRSTGSTVGVGGIAISPIISASPGFFNVTSTSYVAVTNLSVTITTSGRPVCIGIINTTGTDTGIAGIATNSTGNFYISVFRGATQVATYVYSPPNTVIPGPNLLSIDPVSAGTYTYTFQMRCGGSGSGQEISIGNGYALMAYEL